MAFLPAPYLPRPLQAASFLGAAGRGWPSPWRVRWRQRCWEWSEVSGALGRGREKADIWGGGGRMEEMALEAPGGGGEEGPECPGT